MEFSEELKGLKGLKGRKENECNQTYTYNKEPLKPARPIRLISETPNYFLFGHLEHLSNMSGYSHSSLNPLLEFQNWFIRYHKAVLLTEWNWNRKAKEPYVYVSPIGIYTDLNILAKKIRNQISYQLKDKFGNNYEEYKNYKPSITFYGDTLHVDLPWENYSLECEYIDMDNQDERRGYEGWKFELNTNTNTNTKNTNTNTNEETI